MALTSQQTKILMWIFTILLFLGIIMTYYNLNGNYGKYKGLIMMCVGLLGSVLTATVFSSKEGFKSPNMRNLKRLYI